jgi:hypothetical protein
MYGGEVRVYAGVLPFETEKEFIEREMQKSEVPFGVNPDLFDSQKELYYQKSSKNYKEIELQISKINLGLRELGIDHGHKHDRNYLVQMYKGKPRVYLIDFDQAKIGLTY